MKVNLQVLCCAIIATVSVASFAPAGVLATYDFQSSTVDQLPDGPDNFFMVDTEPSDSPDGTPDRLFTSGPGGAIADRFGSTGNKSVVLTNRPSPATQPQMNFYQAWSDDPADFTNGKIEFDMVMASPTDADGELPKDEFWGYVNFRAGHGDDSRFGLISGVTGDTTISVNFRQRLVLPATIASEIYNGGNGASIAVSPDTATHVEFRILPPDPNDAYPNGSFELRIDGQLVNWSNGTNTQPWMSTSVLTSAGSPGINMISFVGASESLGQNGAAEVWIDNIVITKIPEPGSVCLGLCGTIMVSVAFLKNHRIVPLQ